MGVVVERFDGLQEWWNYRATCARCGYRWHGIVREKTQKGEFECTHCVTSKVVVCSAGGDGDAF